MKIEKALVVDDSKVAHLNLRKLLAQRGVEVDWVGSGEDCLAYLRKQTPDVVFMDVMMPGMDGFDTTGAIHSDPAIHAPPVIICSANATDEDRENAEKNGAVEFLSKPYTADKLDKILAKVGESIKGAPEVELSIIEPGMPSLKTAPGPELDQPTAPALDMTSLTEAAERVATETAERVAHAAAEDVARKVAGEIVRRAAEKTIRMAMEKSESVAREAAKTAANEVARSVAEETVRSLGADPASKDSGERRAEGDQLESLRQDLQAQISQDLQRGLNEFFAGDDFNRTLTKAIEETTGPVVESSARQSATHVVRETAMQVVDEATSSLEESLRAGGRSNRILSSAALVVSMLAVAAVVVFNFVL
jgi:CheY-like chemotaxis protein